MPLNLSWWAGGQQTPSVWAARHDPGIFLPPLTIHTHTHREIHTGNGQGTTHNTHAGNYTQGTTHRELHTTHTQGTTHRELHTGNGQGTPHNYTHTHTHTHTHTQNNQNPQLASAPHTHHTRRTTHRATREHPTQPHTHTHTHTHRHTHTCRHTCWLCTSQITACRTQESFGRALRTDHTAELSWV